MARPLIGIMPVIRSLTCGRRTRRYDAGAAGSHTGSQGEPSDLGQVGSRRRSGQWRVRMFREVCAGSFVLDQFFVEQPFDRPTLGADVTEGLPG